jgi:hypothetical protein
MTPRYIENGPVKVTLDSNTEPIVAGFGAGARAQLMGYFIRADWAWGIDRIFMYCPGYSIFHSVSISKSRSSPWVNTYK